MTILSQYKASLKHPAAEELLDLYLFRPIAFLLTRLLVRTSVTPNQITGAAILSGFVAGICLADGRREGFVLGAFFYALANILDCCDGMVARLKKNGTELGRMVDVFADLITGSAVYIGLGIGLTRAAGFELPVGPWLLVIVGGVCFAIQSALFDRERNRFLARVNGDGAEQIAALDDLESRLERGETGSSARTLLIRLYLRYMQSQRALIAPVDNHDPEFDARMVRLWSITGSTTHVMVFVVAMLVGAPMILFGYTIVFANVWLLSITVKSFNHQDTKDTKQHKVSATILGNQL